MDSTLLLSGSIWGILACVFVFFFMFFGIYAIYDDGKGYFLRHHISVYISSVCACAFITTIVFVLDASVSSIIANSILIFLFSAVIYFIFFGFGVLYGVVNIEKRKRRSGERKYYDDQDQPDPDENTEN